jgi:hypothetical protein
VRFVWPQQLLLPDSVACASSGAAAATVPSEPPSTSHLSSPLRLSSALLRRRRCVRRTVLVGRRGSAAVARQGPGGVYNYMASASLARVSWQDQVLSSMVGLMTVETANSISIQ